MSLSSIGPITKRVSITGRPLAVEQRDLAFDPFPVDLLTNCTGWS